MAGVAIALCFALPATTAPKLAQDQLAIPVPNGPIKLYPTATSTRAEYCPDNTCDVIKFKGHITPKTFSAIALAYYFHFSRYSYLAEWQRDKELGAKIDTLLRENAHLECRELSGRSLAECELRVTARGSRVELYFVRYSEGAKSIQKISFSEAIRR